MTKFSELIAEADQTPLDLAWQLAEQGDVEIDRAEISGICAAAGVKLADIQSAAERFRSRIGRRRAIGRADEIATERESAQAKLAAAEAAVAELRQRQARELAALVAPLAGLRADVQRLSDEESRLRGTAEKDLRAGADPRIQAEIDATANELQGLERSLREHVAIVRMAEKARREFEAHRLQSRDRTIDMPTVGPTWPAWHPRHGQAIPTEQGQYVAIDSRDLPSALANVEAMEDEAAEAQRWLDVDHPAEVARLKGRIAELQAKQLDPRAIG